MYKGQRSSLRPKHVHIFYVLEKEFEILLTTCNNICTYYKDRQFRTLRLNVLTCTQGVIMRKWGGGAGSRSKVVLVYYAIHKTTMYIVHVGMCVKDRQIFLAQGFGVDPNNIHC